MCVLPKVRLVREMSTNLVTSSQLGWEAGPRWRLVSLCRVTVSIITHHTLHFTMFQ